MSKGPPQGTHRIFSSGIGLRKSLADALFQPTPLAEPKGPTICNGPKARKYSHHSTEKHPDAVVLEVRRLREQCLMTAGHIVSELAKHGIEVSRGQVITWFNYASRGHLVPDGRTESYLP